MAKHCEVCGKIGAVGSNISHAHNVTKRRWEPNLQRVRVKTGSQTQRMWVCTRCLRSGKIEKGVSKESKAPGAEGPNAGPPH